MSRVQVIEQDDKPAFYVVPADLWDRVKQILEDAEDTADLERFQREDDGVRFPASVAHAIAEGASPLRAWREFRGLTLQSLADAAGLSKPYLNQIEGGKRAGTAATLKKLGAALDVPVGALVL